MSHVNTNGLKNALYPHIKETLAGTDARATTTAMKQVFVKDVR